MIRKRLGSIPARTLVRAARIRLADDLARIGEFVRCESPSGDAVAVARCAEIAVKFAGETARAGGVRLMIREHKSREFGPALELEFFAADFRPRKKAGRIRRSGVPPPILLLGHFDTVWPIGTLGSMPFRVTGTHAHGPGVFDMKAGIIMALSAIEIAAKASFNDQEITLPPITLLLVPDEEVGSPFSRRITESIARTAAAVFVLEPAQGAAGAYKTERKGVGDFRISVTGVAAHSGVDFLAGHSAIVELARQIERIRSFTNLERGITVNPGTISGGTRSNVIAAHAHADIDVRIARAGQAAVIERRFRGLRAFDRGCSITVEGGLNRPPMERTAATVRLFRTAQRLAADLGFELDEAATGGGSDGNFTAAIGVPTLDGMGAVGEGAHATSERIVLRHIAPRTALLAAMLLEVGAKAAK